MKKVFKNITFEKRDFQTTNLVYCIAENAPSGKWREDTNEDAELFEDAPAMNTTHLYTSNGVKYYGFN